MLAVAALLMELSATLDVADRSELRVRGAQAQPVGFDVLNMPLARFTLHDREQLYWLGYALSLTASDIQLKKPSTLVLHTASTGAGWQLSRQVRLTVTEDATYGEQNYAFLASTSQAGVGATTTGPTPPVTPAPSTQALPSAGTITIVGSRSSISSSVLLSRRWTTFVTGSLSMSGGADDYSRNNVPFQRTERMDVGLTYAATRVDALLTAADVSRLDLAHFNCNQASGFPVLTLPPGTGPQCNPSLVRVEATETWSHRLTRLTDFSIDGGAVLSSSREYDAETPVTRVYATGGAVLRRQLQGMRPATGSISLSARMGPILDIRTGRLDERGLLDLLVTDRSGPWQGRVSMSASQSIPPTDTNAITLFTGSLEGGYALSKRIDLGTGVRAAWQSQLSQGAFYALNGYVFFTYHEPTMLLW